jgi:hypothetical protein
MDIDYLTSEILPQRKLEMKQGKNLSTRQPIYVVLSLVEHFCSGHNDFSMSTNLKGIEGENGYLDMDKEPEARVFKESDARMKKPEEVTRFYTDRFVAFFLTSKAAHDYLKYQNHNLDQGYVYVFYSGYANQQMDKLLTNE